MFHCLMLGCVWMLFNTFHSVVVQLLLHSKGFYQALAGWPLWEVGERLPSVLHCPTSLFGYPQGINSTALFLHYEKGWVELRVCSSVSWIWGCVSKHPQCGCNRHALVSVCLTYKALAIWKNLWVLSCAHHFWHHSNENNHCPILLLILVACY